MTPSLDSIDHLVLTVADIDATLSFYRDALGMTVSPFTVADTTNRWALKFGIMKINLHLAGAGFEPKAAHVQPGSADLCFLSAAPLTDWQRHLAEWKIPIEEGPVPRTGAIGPILSIYLRDPDGNLIEIANRV